MTLDPRSEMTYRLDEGLNGIPKLSEKVEVFLKTQGWHETKIYQVVLVLDELLTNTISYGYPDDDQCLTVDISVFLNIDNDILHIIIKDNGIPFNPLKRPPPHTQDAIEDRPIGGLGIHLTHTFMDKICYERQGNTNVLRLQSKMNERFENDGMGY